MFFLIVNTVTYTLTGTRWKHYVCDQCRQPYHYPVTKTITQTGQTFFWLFLGSVRKGVKRCARKKLDAIATSNSDPCPCPSCGAYQRRMYRSLANTRYKWMGWAAAACVPLWIASLLLLYSLAQPAGSTGSAHDLEVQRDTFDSLASVLSLVWLVIAAGFLVGCSIRRWWFDPNRAIPLAHRLGEASRLAFTDDQYEVYLQTATPDAPEGDDEPDRVPDASERFIQFALLFGLAIGAGVGAVKGYDGWAGVLGGALLGAFGGFFVALVLGLVVAILLKLLGIDQRNPSTEPATASQTR